MNKGLKLLIVFLFTILICSCDNTIYHYRTKIYYLDGSTKIIEYDDFKDYAEIHSNRGSYAFRTSKVYIEGVDRFDVLSSYKK